jgi:hypothetical protein
MSPSTYRARLRFRLHRKLNINAQEHRLMIKGHEVALAPALHDVKISESEWLVFNTRGFATSEEATNFGHRLRAALELSSVSARVGVDAGIDRATSGLGHQFRQSLKEQTGRYIRDNIHGLDVFLDEPNVGFFAMQATGSVLVNPEPFLVDLEGLFDVAANTSTRSNDIVLLLNAALMQPHPVAQIVFAFSAVEMLGQEYNWTDGQKRLLSQLAEMADASSVGAPDERAEVADAIRRSHRFSLRQGVMRLLADLGLSHLKPLWDRTYAERSTLIHGLAPRPGADYSEFANRALNLCGHILLKAVAVDVPAVDRHAERLYQV